VVSAAPPGHLCGRGDAATIRWGKQLDIQQLTTNDEQERRRRASYLAKYSTKSTEQASGRLHPIHPNDVDHAQVSEHVRRYLRTAFVLHDHVIKAIRADDLAECMTPPRPAPAAFAVSQRAGVAGDGGDEQRRTHRCWTSGPMSRWPRRVITAAPPQAVKRDKGDRRLAACAHTFGYRGHCLIESHHWSTMFMHLRQVREQHVCEQLLADSADPAQRDLAQLAAHERIAAFEFVGVGHFTTVDAYPLKPSPEHASTASWRAKCSTRSRTEGLRTDAEYRRTRRSSCSASMPRLGLVLLAALPPRLSHFRCRRRPRRVGPG